MHHAGLLPDDQRPLSPPSEPGWAAVRNRNPDRSPRDNSCAAGVEQPMLNASFSGELPRPEQLAGFEIHVPGTASLVVGRRIRVVVPRGDIQSAELFIDGRRRPDSGAGRPVLLVPAALLAGRLGCLGDRESLPELLSRGRIQRHDAASERAALEIRIGRQSFFEGRERLVDHAIVEVRRRGGHGREVIHRPDLPDQLARRRIQRVHRRAASPKKTAGVPLASPTVTPARTRCRLESPVGAAGIASSEYTAPVSGSDEHASTDDRGLRSRHRDVAQIESPFELESSGTVELRSSALAAS